MLRALKNLNPYLLYCLVAIVSFSPFYNTLPSGIHAWGQADRYAIAKRFQEPNSTPFIVKTYNIASEDGRTGAEFPLTQFLAAKLSHIFGQDYLPSIFRFLNFLIFSIGLWMFLHSFRIKNKHLLSLLAPILLSAPIVIFYSYNFLPDIIGLGFILASYSFLNRYMIDGKYKWVWWCVGIGILGSLIKLSVAIYLIANICYFGIQIIRSKQFKILGILIFISSVGLAIIGLYVNKAMIEVNEKYWSVVFRAHSNPIQNLKDFADVFKGMAYWRTEYLSIPLYTIVLVSLVILSVRLVKKKIKMRLEGYLFHSIIVLLGLSAFMIVLGKQFIHHDYYFISTFMPLVFLLSVWFVKMVFIPHQISPLVKTISFALLTLFAVLNTPKSFSNRIQDQYLMRKHVIENNVGWLNELSKNPKLFDAIFEDNDINESDKVFALYHESPNIPLVYFQRKGMCFNHEEIQREQPFIEYWLPRVEPKLLASQKKWAHLFLEDKPDLHSNLEVIYETDNLVIWKSKSDWKSHLDSK